MKFSVATPALNESVEKSQLVDFNLHICRALVIFVRASELDRGYG